MFAWLARNAAKEERGSEPSFFVVNPSPFYRNSLGSGGSLLSTNRFNFHRPLLRGILELVDSEGAHVGLKGNHGVACKELSRQALQ